MRRWRGRFRRNHGAAGAGPAPLVSPVRAADLAAPACAVVAGELARRVAAAVLPAGSVLGFATVRGFWSALLTGDAGPLPRLVVVAQDAAADREELATALAYLAPRTRVVLLHRRDDLEDLGECYLRVVADHPGKTDADAPVEVVEAPGTGVALAAALRAAAPADLPVLNCPPELAGPLGQPPSPPQPPTGSAPAAPPPHRVPPPPHEPRATVVAVVSAKGGAGKSTTAVALAATLARSAPARRVCVVDLDVRDGQLAALLGQHTPDAATLLADSRGITDASVLAHLIRADRLGVHALLAPPHSRDETELLTGRAYRQVLIVLRRHFDVIVLDCPVTYREPLLAGMALVEADHIAAVTTLAVTSLTGLDRLLHTLADPPTAGGLGVPTRKFGIVVNAALNGVAIDRAQVARHSHRLPLVAVVPHAARDVLIATNRQRLDLLLDHPDLAPAYRHLAAWCTTSRPARSAAPIAAAVGGSSADSTSSSRSPTCSV